MNAKRSRRNFVAGATGIFLLLLPAFANAGMREAKKEGQILWYSSLSLKIAQEVCNNFNKKKTGVRCVLHRSSTGKIYRRFLQEAKSGVYRADLINTANIGQFLKLRKKWLKPYKIKGIERFRPLFRNDHHAWSILRFHLMAPLYNTKKVKPGEEPKSWKDFLDPKWRGKIGQAHPSYSGAATVAMIALVDRYGLSFFEKLAEQKTRIVNQGPAVTAITARGEAHVSLGAPSYTTYNAIKRGEPLKMFIPKEGVVFVLSPSAILKTAPHPNAAKVYSDYLFSREVQQLLADRGLYVGHPDVTYPPGVPSLKSLKLIEIPPAEIKKKTKEMRKAFRKIFGV